MNSKDSSQKIMLSGIKPTGIAHLGNYFGAMKQFVEMQDSYKTFVMIADLHSLNSVQDAKLMRDFTESLVLDYLAIGLDPKKVILFKQSDVPAHAELTWIFDCIITMPYLMRAHAFKDHEAKNKEVSVGLFNYPVLMAADILLYDSDVVPVGQDQKQHLEYARDIAEKFNRIFATDIFKLPMPKILEEVAVVPGIDGKKMSKSYNNTIPLFASKEEILKLCMSIVTDSSGNRPENVYNIHKLFKGSATERADLDALYEAKKGKYKELKEALAADIEAFIAPLREKRAMWESKPEEIRTILEQGADRARSVAEGKMIAVKKVVGLV